MHLLRMLHKGDYHESKERGDPVPSMRRRIERDREHRSLLKNRVVDLKSFRRLKKVRLKKTHGQGYRTILFIVVLILLFLSVLCGILGLIAIPWRAQLAIWSAFFSSVGMVGGLCLVIVADKRAQKIMGFLCIGMLLAFVAGIVKTGL